MATTEIYYPYDGNNPTRTQFPFPFEYITKDDVKVSINDVETTAYTYANDTTIELNSALTQGQELRIFRYTAIDDLKANFASGSSIRAKDLNDNFLQNNFAVQEIRNYSWDNETQTIHSNETWVGSDDQIATTSAMDARFWDQDGDVTQSTENFEDTDDKIMTAAAIDDRIDHVITNDIGTDGTGITVTDDGDGTITLGIAQNSVDFDRIKNSDIINNAEQDASSVNPADTNLFTALAATRRFDTIVQTGRPTGNTWETGKTWYQNDEDQTVHIYDPTAADPWVPITSGGSFTRLDQVIYVDSVNGNDNNNGHRISSPKRTIRAAIQDINADATHGDGSTVVVAPGVYGEEFPIDIQRNDVSIVGTSLRNCIIHPAIPEADQAGYAVNVPEANELQTMFRVNSGTYIANLTLMGMKASGPRGGNALDNDATFGLPTNQGWNFAFFPNAIIRKSPYIQNCTNFSDSRINNVDFNPHTQTEGAAGDLTSDPSGGGILINGATVAGNSPLRSMVCDSYTHTALDGPGIFVTNNGYCQATSSYSFFNHYHLKCLNGGQANLAASTTDFGRFSLIADGRSTTHIFTATVDGTFNAGEASFNIDNLVDNWFGTATRPQDNMLVEIGTDVYPITSATVNGNGWTVNIIRPDPDDRTANLGLINGLTNATPVRFYLRSMIASSGHTMEYVGSGTDYDALPQNGGVPVDANQITELNDGKIWAATTDHKGTFKVGETFEVDQETGLVNIPAGALSVSVLLADLDVNGQEIVTTDPNQDIVLNPNGTGVVNVSTSNITNVVDPVNAQDAATRNYVDTFVNQTANIGDLQVTGAKIANDTIDSSKLTGATVVTNSEHAAATTNDTSFFTTSASDARYFRQDSSETITSGVTWSSSDSFVATTAAIDARVVDLVDEVGGFVPIANETSFPTTNPDINDGAGTLISIQEIGTSRTPSAGTVTIANGSGSNTVTINGCGSTVLSAGFGAIVETTTTLHTYNFHRLTPKATEVTTVAGISSDVTTVSGISSNVTTVAGISSNVTTVAGISSDVTTVAGKATEIGRLGTADAVADMALLGTTDVVADMNLLATNDVVSDMNTLATTANVTAMSNCSDDISNINTVAGSISNVNTAAGSITNINTVANNINSVNDFADKYRIGATDPTTNNDDGDLFYNTTSDTLKIWDGSAWQTGVTDTAGFVTTSGATMTGQLNTITPTSGSNATNKTYVDDTIDSKIDTALTSDVVGGTGITVSDNTPNSGQITIDVTAGSIGPTQLASTTVASGSYGSSTQVGSFTVDADGRLTAASNTSINFPAANLSTSTSTTSVTVNSSTGTNATIGEATSSAAGVMSTAHHDKLDGIAAGAQVNVATNLSTSTSSTSVTVNSSTGTNATIGEATGSAAGVMSVAHHNKLDGIESGATADQTASEILTLIKTVDGAGSGLDADTLDGISSGSFLRSDTNDSFSGGYFNGEETIGTSSFNLNAGHFWTCGAIAIPNPTNGSAGFSGLIRVTAAPTSFGSNWDFPGGSYTAPSAFPAVAPFYVVNSTTFYLGPWTEGIA